MKVKAQVPGLEGYEDGPEVQLSAWGDELLWANGKYVVAEDETKIPGHTLLWLSHGYALVVKTEDLVLFKTTL